MNRKNTQSNKNSTLSESKDKTYNKNKSLVKKNVLGVEVTDAKKEEILEYIMNSVKNSSQNYYITTPNPEMIVYAHAHPDFQAILNGAEIALCDGVGLLWGAGVLGKPLTERFTGVELVEKLCGKANNQLVTIGFFGGKPGVAELTAECLLNKYPNLKVVYAGDAWDASSKGPTAPHSALMASLTSVQSRHSSGDSQSCQASDLTSFRSSRVTPQTHSSSLITPSSSIDILFVALGFPKQEQWMAEHVGKIPVKVMIGVGGAFDFLSGRVVRAPGILRSIGLEWLFRLIAQPWRWRRQLALPKFVWMVVRERLRR